MSTLETMLLTIIVGLTLLVLVGYIYVMMSQDRTILFLICRVCTLQEKITIIKDDNNRIYAEFAKLSDAVDSLLMEKKENEEE